MPASVPPTHHAAKPGLPVVVVVEGVEFGGIVGHTRDVEEGGAWIEVAGLAAKHPDRFRAWASGTWRPA